MPPEDFDYDSAPAQVVHIFPQVEHFEPCDRDVYGRVTLALLKDFVMIARPTILDGVREWRSNHTCGCLELRIWTAEKNLTAARKAFSLSLSDENADRVERMGAELSRLRGMK